VGLGPNGTGQPIPRRGSGWDARRILLANLVVLAVAAGFGLLYRFAAALFILFIGVALGMAVKPGVDWLRRRGVPRWIGALAIYAALAGVFTGVVVVALPVIAEQVGALIARGPERVEALRAELLGSQSRTLQRIAAYVPSSSLLSPSSSASSTTHAAHGGASTALDVTTMASYAAAMGRNVFTVAAVLLLGFYWTLEGDRRVRALAFFVPFESRRGVRAFIAEVERTVGAYLRGQALVCLIIGLLALGIYSALGVPHAVVLGLIYAIGEAVPVVGPIVGTSVAALVATSVSTSLILPVIAGAVILQLVENYVLVPKVMDRAVGVNPFVTLLAIAAFGSVLGVAGAVLAIPLAAIVQLLLYRFLLDIEAQQRELPVGRTHVSVVRYEVRELTIDVRKLLRLRQSAATRHPGGERAERIEDAVEGIAYDLDRILAERETAP
jgi:predicted PurR-regulated permease PerM